MPMSLRLLLSLLSFAVALCGQDAEKTFVHEFGAKDAVGSFRARFAREGGGLVWLQAADHRLRVGSDDRLLLVYNGADHGLRLSLATPSSAFPLAPELASWEVESAGDRVTFRLDGKNGLVLEKVLRHDPQQRGFVVELVLKNTGSTATGSLDLVLGGPMLVVPNDPGLFLTATAGMVAPNQGDVQAFAPAAGTVHKATLDGVNLQFAGTSNRFFGAFVWPRDDAAKQALKWVEFDTLPLAEDKESGTLPNTTLRARYGLTLAIPAPNAETRATLGLFLGPKSYRVFATLPEPLRFEAILDHDLKAPCCFIEMPAGKQMAQVLLWLLGHFYDLVGNWGVAIMMLTLLVRGLMAPLNFRMQKSMRAYGARMAVLKPKMDALKAKYGDDQRGYQQAMIAFQRENKLLPPLGGCLPIFLTMPIYIGLFTALRTAYEVRQQPFVGWIGDLSRPDALFELPFFPGHLNLLPVVWLALTAFLTLRQPLPTDPQQRQQMQIMRFMPRIFGVMLYNYAAALLVYMVTSAIWTVVESTVIKRILGPIDPNAAMLAPTPM
jgi:YidC/Oxa1 family membrane protein insertase